jgi:periplasmic protein CpxP/Spy
MKRFTLSVVITAILGLAAYTAASAQGPGFGPGFGGRRGGFGPGGSAALRGIELSDDQREQIRTIREAERESWNGPPPGVQLQRQLEAELFAEYPDAKKLAALRQQIVQAHAVMLERRTAVEQKIAQVLTPEQRATVRERLAQEPQERRGRAPRTR